MFRSLLKYDEIHRTGRKVKILPTVVPGRSITQARKEGKGRGDGGEGIGGAAGDGGDEKDRPYRSLMRQIMNICIHMREKQEKYCIKMHKTD
jgi:hypothetical protein